MLSPFHLAFPVNNIKQTEQFYGEVLGCTIGRQAERWIDFNFFGHQVSAHLRDGKTEVIHNPVDGDSVPVPHFGVILAPAEWQALAERIESHGIEFLIGPRTRFAGEPGEQSTLFIKDPSGNGLEFKAFQDPGKIFES